MEHFPPGEPTPFSYAHLGLRYPGEVVTTSDLSALPNTITVELVDFIRRVLG